jgi:hypothetical protein
MDDPSYLTTPGTVCDRCLLMTSTAEGIKALISESGYQHHNMKELQSSANRCCPLCRLCCFYIYHSRVWFRNNRFLRFHAQGSDGSLDNPSFFTISKLVFKIQDRGATLAMNFELHTYTSKVCDNDCILSPRLIALEETMQPLVYKKSM